MEPCTNSRGISAAFPDCPPSSARRPVQRSASYVNLEPTQSEKKAHLNRRVSKSTKNLRVSLKDTLKAFEEADSTNKHESALPAPSVQSSPRANPAPNILNRLRDVLQDKSNGELKRRQNYALTLAGPNLLYWKEVSRPFLVSFLKDAKAKKSTLHALHFIHGELVSLIKADQTVSYPALVDIYCQLKENKICKSAFKDDPELHAHYLKLLKMTARG